jgi:hypothetical protein
MIRRILCNHMPTLFNFNPKDLKHMRILCLPMQPHNQPRSQPPEHRLTRIGWMP